MSGRFRLIVAYDSSVIRSLETRLRFHAFVTSRPRDSVMPESMFCAPAQRPSLPGWRERVHTLKVIFFFGPIHCSFMRRFSRLPLRGCLPESRAPHSHRNIIIPGLFLPGSAKVALRFPCTGHRCVSLAAAPSAIPATA